MQNDLFAGVLSHPMVQRFIRANQLMIYLDDPHGSVFLIREPIVLELYQERGYLHCGLIHSEQHVWIWMLDTIIGNLVSDDVHRKYADLVAREEATDALPKSTVLCVQNLLVFEGEFPDVIAGDLGRVQRYFKQYPAVEHAKLHDAIKWATQHRNNPMPPEI